MRASTASRQESGARHENAAEAFVDRGSSSCARNYSRSIGRCAIVPIAAACGGPRPATIRFPRRHRDRTENALQALANGNAVGTVAAGAQATFTVNLPESNANTFNNGMAPTPQADVTFTAKDMRTVRCRRRRR